MSIIKHGKVMFIKKTICIIVFFLFSIMNIFAHRFAIEIKLTGLSIHPRGAEHANLFRFNLDRNGFFVLNPGIRIGFEYFIFEDIVSIKIAQGLYRDCANQFGGFSHIGFRCRVFQWGNHSFNGGIGPTFFFRRNWYKLEGYSGDDAFFRGGPEDNWQRRFIWWGGDLEYNYRINERFELSTSVIPPLPFLPALIHVGTRMLFD